MDKIATFLMSLDLRNSRLLEKYYELECKIRMLTGKDLESLERLFAAGWTLEPPKEQTSLLEAMAELAIDESEV